MTESPPGFFSRENPLRIIIELIIIIVVFEIVFVWAISPWLQSVAPALFAGELDYSRFSVPDTPLDVVHLFSMVAVLLSFLYWRIDSTNTPGSSDEVNTKD